ncbi:MAG: alpha-amylase family glycosyl hydrolase [Phycisphaerales bacterium]|jgi:1,4-alpha-glucan branching enzyme|nr:alpha-amylase family glycosyl hydrolase [Phycisphaerales bacterium]
MFGISMFLTIAVSYAEDRVDPSAHAGMGAVPYGGAGCQVWLQGETAWANSGTIRPDLTNASSGTVKWGVPLTSIGIASGDTVRFDIATSGSGTSDPGVDHLSRSDQATDGWATPSVSGTFLEYVLDGTSGSLAIPDSLGDVFDFANLDIDWVVVSHDSQNLYFTVNVDDNLTETDWTNFMFFLDTKEGGTSDNPWGRPIDLGSEEIDVFLGSWVNNAEAGVSFRTWAPNASAVAVVGDFNNWSMWSTMLATEGDGKWSVDVSYADIADEYQYVIINNGVQYWRNDAHAKQLTNSIGNSVVYDPDAYLWNTTDFSRPAWNEMVVYEMHVGTFAGGFLQAASKLDYLVELGVNAIELMPVWEFAGDLSWGYNAAHPFAVESSYGSPNELKRFIDEAHERGIAVLLDVVYNHWGPSDMDLWQYDGWSENNLGGIYFYNDDRAWTPWGDTRPNYSVGEVRTFIRDSVLYWLEEYRLDGLRIDGTKWIRATDDGGTEIPEGWTLLQWINDEVDAHDSGKAIICEDLAGTDWMTKSTGEGGAGFDSQWDVYWIHPVRGLIETANDSDRSMWTVRDAVMAVYNGDQTDRVIYTESHDEVANGRSRVPEEIAPGDAGNWFARKRSTLGAAMVLTSAGIPMLFQGQEFLEDGYFDDDDPLDWSKTTTYSGILQLYTDLIALRLNTYGNSGGLSGGSTNVHHINDTAKVAAYHRWGDGGIGDDVVVAMNFTVDPRESYRIGFPQEGEWYLIFNSDDTAYADDYGNVGHDVTATNFGYDGLPYSGLLDLAPYSVQIFSQVPNPAESCPEDISGDGVVSVDDLLTMISGWGTPDWDINGDGTTDVSDLLAVIGAFGPCP